LLFIRPPFQQDAEVGTAANVSGVSGFEFQRVGGYLLYCFPRRAGLSPAIHGNLRCRKFLVIADFKEPEAFPPRL